MLTVRSEESDNGIQVFDSNGNPVGLSKAAGEKVQYLSNSDLDLLSVCTVVSFFLLPLQAVRETALSRAALFGTTAAVPNLLFFLLRRSVAFLLTLSFKYAYLYLFCFLSFLGAPIWLVD